MPNARDIRGKPPEFDITVNGQAVPCRSGDTVLAVLLACGMPHLRRSARSGAARSAYCNMGICYDCAVTVDGAPLVRACMTDVRPGMRIETDD